MANKIPLRQWVENFNNGYYDESSFDAQIAAGWYDWFCGDLALAAKTKRIGSILAKITNDYLLDNFYVWFKNNFDEPFYDTVHITHLDDEHRDMHIELNIDRAGDDAPYSITTWLPYVQEEYTFLCADSEEEAAYIIDEAAEQFSMPGAAEALENKSRILYEKRKKYWT